MLINLVHESTCVVNVFKCKAKHVRFVVPRWVIDLIWFKYSDREMNMEYDYVVKESGLKRTS